MKNPKLLTVDELALLLNITTITLKKLAATKQVPCVHVNRRLLFDFNAVIKHFQQLERGEL